MNVYEKRFGREDQKAHEDDQYFKLAGYHFIHFIFIKKVQ